MLFLIIFFSPLSPLKAHNQANTTRVGLVSQYEKEAKKATNTLGAMSQPAHHQNPPKATLENRRVNLGKKSIKTINQIP